MVKSFDGTRAGVSTKTSRALPDLLGEFNSFPGLVRIAAQRINAVSPLTASPTECAGCYDNSYEGGRSLDSSAADDSGCCGGHRW